MLQQYSIKQTKEVYKNKDTQKENIHKKSIKKIMMIAGTRRRLLY